MTQLVAESCKAEGLTDTIVAVEMTGIYHKPVQRAFRKARFDTRIVHPFASHHYRRPLHPDEKTDDNDLEAIFHAAVKGYGLATLPVGEVYQSLQALSRHRHNLVKQRARLMVQIRRLLHQTMPGFADLFEGSKLFHKSIALPVALKFSSAAAIRHAGVAGIASHLNKTKVRFQTRTIERIVPWASTAAEPSDLAAIATPPTGWLADRFGRKRFLVGSVAAFTVSTLLCGFATSLPELILWRTCQGLFGAPLVPLSQAITLDTFPKEQHGTATALWGMGVMLGPILGPTIGGYMTELYDWRWVFFIVVPFRRGGGLRLRRPGAGDRPQTRPPPRLVRLPRAFDRGGDGAADVRSWAAPGLVRIHRDRGLGGGRGDRALSVRGPQPDRGASRSSRCACSWTATSWSGWC